MSLKVLLVGSEAAPYVKTGGLGDVLGVLPKALQEQGIDARVIFPKHHIAKLDHLEEIARFSIGMGYGAKEAKVYKVDNSDSVYTVENDHFFWRDGLYGYGDDHERYYFFTKAVLEFIKTIEFKPDIIHFNDWQVGMGSFILKEVYHDDPFYKDIKTLFSIHNIQHQGNFDRGILHSIDVSDYYFTSDKIELYGRVSYMKAGIMYSDVVSTVSKKYAKEIQTPAFGFGLDGAMASRKKDLYGIINGIEYDDDIEFMNAPKDRAYLQEKLGLPRRDVPVIALISRLVEQKGIDILSVAMSELLNMDIQLIVLGTGEYRYEEMFKGYNRIFDNFSANIYFDVDLSMDIYKHADMFLMPSLFEPCGLAQMISMKYGTVPIVRKTGGLEDTVTHFDKESGEGNGFSFEDYDANGLMWAVRNAMETFNDPEAWDKVVQNAKDSRFTVEDSAKKYIKLYEKMRG